jgi:hypothetical protein
MRSIAPPLLRKDTTYLILEGRDTAIRWYRGTRPISLARLGEMCKLKTVVGRERDLLDTVPPKATAHTTLSVSEEPFIDVAPTDP